jgi:hypothetical protein
MALSREQRAELESRGADNVRQKLFESGSGRGAVVRGFKCGEIERGEVEDWLAEKYREEAAVQRSTLRWAQIAGWAGLAGVVASIKSRRAPRAPRAGRTETATNFRASGTSASSAAQICR